MLVISQGHQGDKLYIKFKGNTQSWDSDNLIIFDETLVNVKIDPNHNGFIMSIDSIHCQIDKQSLLLLLSFSFCLSILFECYYLPTGELNLLSNVIGNGIFKFITVTLNSRVRRHQTMDDIISTLLSSYPSFDGQQPTTTII
ncbi:hypothetical protein BLOT_010373, partial [Blomia tropicalis]